MADFCLSEVLKQKLHEAELTMGDRDQLVDIDCSMLDTWEYRDRMDCELGDIKLLAESIRLKGQAQPIVLVQVDDTFKPKSNPDVQYVVIAGYRRWLACKMNQQKVQAVVRNLSFKEAIACLVSENEKQSVSDFSLGLFYHNLLVSEKITQEQLSKKACVGASTLNQLLAFAQVPASLWERVPHLRKVSRTVAAKVRKYWNIGTEYQEALYEIAPMLGKSASTKKWEETLVYIVTGVKPNTVEPPFVVNQNGTRLLTVKKGQVKFNKDIAQNESFAELRDQIATITQDFYNRNVLTRKK